MKKQIRQGVFETNSSSTHSLTMCMESDYDKWCSGETYFYKGWGYGFAENFKPKENHFYTYDECIEFLKHSNRVLKENENVDEWTKEEIAEVLRDYEFIHYDDDGNEYYEWFEETYETPNGERIVAFGYYGWDD